MILRKTANILPIPRLEIKRIAIVVLTFKE